MADIRLIALDMDGTLLDDEKHISDFTRSQIKKAHDRGVHIILSTGRPLSTCSNYVRELDLNTYLITCNGGQIYSENQTVISQNLLDKEKLAYMYHLAKGLGMNSWVVSTEEPYYNYLPENYKQLEWLKFSCHSKDKNILDKMVEKLSYVEGVEISNASPINVEVNPVGVNKAMGLEFVCNQLGLTMENVMAIGDSLNDIKMIQEAGIGIAMDNAQEAVQKVADYMTDTNNNDGVGKAIKKFIFSVDRES